MPLIDTHAHLDDDRFAHDLPAVLNRASAAGVERIIVVATTLASTRKCVHLANSDDKLRPTAGIHPNHAAEADPSDWDRVAEYAATSAVVALGETGLDRHWNFTPFAQQEEYFARHLELSRRVCKPVIIHARDCDADILRMLQTDFERYGPISGVMHSFTGSSATARACLDMGLYISFAGMVTYKSAEPLRGIAAWVPADRILVETDSPYLAPVPHRGQRNEPAFVSHTAECVARVRATADAMFMEQTTANARRLFGI